MARPTDRRPGFSRRAQYGIFTGYVAAGLGCLVGIALLIASLVDASFLAGLRGAAAEVARPVGAAAASSRRGGLDLAGAIGAYFNAGRQNASLRQEVAVARADAARMQALEGENRRLKALLGVREADVGTIASARLIGSTGTSLRRFAVISAGSSSGVMIGQPVRAAQGLIGRVLEVGPDTARVLLVTDPENLVPVRRASDGLPAFVQGGADGRVQVRLINSGVMQLRKGDVLVTSGAGGIYPPGIPVAVVSEPARDGATALLAIDPAAADYVLVGRSYQAAAVTMLTAPPPSPPPPAPKPKKGKTAAPAARPKATPSAAPAPAAPSEAARP